VVDNDTFYNVTTASVGNKVACSVHGTTKH